MRLGILIVLFFAYSCASFQERSCNTQGAYDLGRSHAKQWGANQSKMLAQNCKEVAAYSPSSFSKDYTLGYMEQMNLQCNEGVVEADAIAAANEGDYSHKRLEKYKNCMGKVKFSSLKKKYIKSFSEIFCSETKAISIAQGHASTLSQQDLSFLNPCPSNLRNKLSRIYQKEYEKGVKEQCSPINVTNLAIQDARAKKGFGEGLSNLKKCPANMQSSALRNYRDAFYQEQQRQDRMAYRDQLNMDRRREAIRRSRVDFKAMGRDYYTLCEVAEGKVFPVLYFADDKTAYLTGYFKVQVFDDISNIVENKTNIYASYLQGRTGEKKDITSFSAPAKAYSCKAWYTGQKIQ
ncbi:MAG: hypothetical protein EP319_12340 [Deltaproteobacteria bacterium]|nr:MAG: hypothetical protein EP319_12340 [Deltaproteobacteria bacterium]